MAVALAGAAGLAAASAAAPAGAAPRSARTGAGRLSVRVLTTNRAVLLRTRRLRVQVHAPVAVRSRLSATTPARGAGGRTIALSIARPRTVVVPRGASRVVSLALTPAGLRALRACGRVSVDVTARSRRLRTLSRRRSPAFTGASLLTRRTRRTFAAQPAACRGGVLPGPGGGYFVGIASRSINPGADGRFAGQTVYLGGYGVASPPLTTGRAATGILGDGIHVRALAVSDARHAAAVADIEVQGWFAATRDGPYGLVDMRKEVQRRTGGALSASDVVIQSDHTHSGPDPMGVWGGVPLAYRKFMFDQTVDAVVEAYRNRREGTLYYGTAPGRDLLSNQFGYDAANQVVDSDVRVLQARDERNRPFATLLNFSAHATVLGSDNKKASGDWVQVANPLLEQRFGGRAVTVVGTLGRTQPGDRGCPNAALAGDAKQLCKLDEYARRVVDRAGQAVAAARALTGTPTVAARSYLIQDPGSNAVLLGLLYAGGPAGAPLNRSITPPWQTANVIGTVTGTVRIGDVLLSSIPGEAYPQIAFRVRELATGARGFMTAGLADDQLGYLIAPYQAYPEPIRRTFFNQRGDQVSPVDNDNYAFNVSQTMGERVTCSLLRGAGEVLGAGTGYRDAAGTECAPFVNDALLPAGADAG